MYGCIQQLIRSTYQFRVPQIALFLVQGANQISLWVKEENHKQQVVSSSYKIHVSTQKVYEYLKIQQHLVERKRVYSSVHRAPKAMIPAFEILMHLPNSGRSSISSDGSSCKSSSIRLFLKVVQSLSKLVKLRKIHSVSAYYFFQSFSLLDVALKKKQLFQ